MGDTLWLEVKDSPGCHGGGEDHSILLRLQCHLDRLPDQLGVARLIAFMDSSDQAAECLEWLGRGAEAGLLSDGTLPEADPASLEPQWFDPGPARAAVRALVAHLERCPEDLRFHPDASRAHWPGLLMEELRGCEAALAEAVARGRPFHLRLVS